jgi:hypothetical protein
MLFKEFSYFILIHEIGRAASAPAFERLVSETFSKTAEACLQIIRSAEGALRCSLSVTVINSFMLTVVWQVPQILQAGAAVSQINSF